MHRTIETSRSPGRKELQPGQISRIVTIGRDGANRHVVHESRALIEAPNWTPDGQWLIVNSGGRLYRLPVAGSEQLQPIDTGAVVTCNNDHVLSFDGKTLYVSASGHLYALPAEGGEPRRVSNVHDPARNYRYFLHGVSPDDRTLVYVGIEPIGTDLMAKRVIATIPTRGGEDRRLTDPEAFSDGPEFSPDGAWIYFNSELAARRPGHAQIFRMRPDGSAVEQVTFDERVNWFPHLSPDGKWMIYLSYAVGTLRHPADIDVLIRVMPTDGGPPRDVTSLFGGQGTLNVNGWAPDSERFAYVEYPVVD